MLLSFDRLGALKWLLIGITALVTAFLLLPVAFIAALSFGSSLTHDQEEALRLSDRIALFNAGRKAYLVYGNYEALLGYNCAHAYALAVSQLADRIRR